MLMLLMGVLLLLLLLLLLHRVATLGVLLLLLAVLLTVHLLIHVERLRCGHSHVHHSVHAGTHLLHLHVVLLLLLRWSLGLLTALLARVHLGLVVVLKVRLHLHHGLSLVWRCVGRWVAARHVGTNLGNRLPVLGRGLRVVYQMAVLLLLGWRGW